MAKANVGPSGRKVAGIGLVGSLVLVLCCGGCFSVFGDSNDDVSKRAGGADKAANQQVASTESPATSVLRGIAASPSDTPDGDGTGEDGQEEASGTAPTTTPSQATPTKSTSTKVTTTKAAPKPTPKKTTAKPKPSKTTSKPKPKPSKTTSSVYYKNCDAVRAAGKAPIRIGQPGYGKHLDRDGDGVGCE